MKNRSRLTAHNSVAVGVSRKRLERALLVSAQLTKRYKRTVFEVASLDLFQRMERELALAEQRISIRERAEAILTEQSRQRTGV